MSSDRFVLIGRPEDSRFLPTEMSSAAAASCPRCFASVPASNMDLHLLRCNASPPAAPPPQPSSPPLSHDLVGRAVRVIELSSRPNLNGSVGTVVSVNEGNGRYNVELGGETIALRPTCVQPLAQGEWSCTECTYLNTGSAGVDGDAACSVCGTARGGARAAAPDAPMDVAPMDMDAHDDGEAASSIPGGLLLGGLAGALAGRGGFRRALSGAALGGLFGAVADHVRGASAEADSGGSDARREQLEQQQRRLDQQQAMARAMQQLLSGNEGGGGDRNLDHLPPQLVAMLAGGLAQGGNFELDHETMRQLFPDVPHAASDSLISRLPTHRFNASTRRSGGGEGSAGETEAPSCTVCLCEYDEGDELTTLPCFHQFHTECCTKWLRENGSCPICKHRVDEQQSADFPGSGMS
jgi:hypothetical protein